MAELNFKQITDKLNAEFTGDVRKLIFWYDENAEFQEDVTFYQIWMEDKKSVKTKLDLMENHGLAGVAFWVLGLETNDVWDVVEDYVDQ